MDGKCEVDGRTVDVVVSLFVAFLLFCFCVDGRCEVDGRGIGRLSSSVSLHSISVSAQVKVCGTAIGSLE